MCTLTARIVKCRENDLHTTIDRKKIQPIICRVTPNRANWKDKKSSISCARTGARPVKTAHAPLAEAHTDSARNTPPMPVVNLLPDPRICMLSFDKPMSTTQSHKMLFLPSSVGCQRSRTFLAPNPEQTVPFDVDDVRRTGAGRSLSDEMSSATPPPPPD